MKKAFTLAEVLITLVIIGIIAAITIPALMNNTNDEENIVGEGGRHVRLGGLGQEGTTCSCKNIG